MQHPENSSPKIHRQGVQQAFDAAVHPRLVRQSRIVLIVGSQSAAVLEEAAARLGQYGPNALMEEKRKTPIQVFLEQF